MREIEFLPSWYPRSRRCRRIVVWQGYGLIVLILAAAVWTFFTQRSIRASERTLAAIETQLERSEVDQRILDQKLSLRQQLQTQEELLASVGYSVEMTRLLQKLDELMPRQMSLIEFECTTEETPRQVATVAAVSKSSEKAKIQFDRRLRVKLLGVAPSNTEVATFIAGLYTVPFLDQVSYVNSRDVYDSDHKLREFTVTFCINLNP